MMHDTRKLANNCWVLYNLALSCRRPSTTVCRKVLCERQLKALTTALQGTC